MRGLLWGTVLLAALWGGWWVVGSRGAEAAAVAWFQAQTDEGRRAGYDSLEVRGFPSRFDLTITNPRLADPDRRLSWTSPFAQVFAMSWKPWHLIAALPGGQVFGVGDQTVTLDASRLMASLLMTPGPDLSLSEVVLEGEALVLVPTVAKVKGMSRAVASIRADESRTNGYRLGLSIRDLALDPAFAAEAGLADRLSEVHLDAKIALSAPLDRHAGKNRPALRLFDLREGRVLWGDLQLSGKGEFTADDAGFAAGRIEVRVQNWRLLPPLMVTLGVISSDFAPTLTRGLEVYAAQGDDPDVLVVPLAARNGLLTLGPLPLGPAPYWGE